MREELRNVTGFSGEAGRRRFELVKALEDWEDRGRRPGDLDLSDMPDRLDPMWSDSPFNENFNKMDPRMKGRIEQAGVTEPWDLTPRPVPETGNLIPGMVEKK